jgi:hypothetical protein
VPLVAIVGRGAAVCVWEKASELLGESVIAWLLAGKVVGPRAESRLVRKEGLRWPRLVRRGFSLGCNEISSQSENH